jgi:hemerythrin
LLSFKGEVVPHLSSFLGEQAMHQTESSITDAHLQAHRTLRGELRGLREAARSTPAQRPGDIAAQLGAMRTDLQEHFRFEEENGYMSAVVQLRPNLARAIQHLKGEHEELMRNLNELVAEARSTTKLTASFRDKVDDWVFRVGRHERSENVLVQDAFNLDVAAED